MIFVYARPDARREVHHPGGWKHGSPVDAMVFDGDDGVERAEKPNHGRVHETDARHARRRHRRVPIPLRVFDAMRATRASVGRRTATREVLAARDMLG